LSAKRAVRSALKKWACGAAGSALPWHGRGRRFDPDQVHQNQQLRQLLIPMRVLKGAEVSSLPSVASSQQLSNSHPLLLGDRTSVDVERRPTARMSQQFLSYFDVHPQCPKFVASEWRKLCHPICLPTMPARANAGRILFSSRLSGLRGLLPLSRIEGKRKSASVA
jgi:hypothetical protein